MVAVVLIAFWQTADGARHVPLTAGPATAYSAEDTTPPHTWITEGPAEGSTIIRSDPQFGWAADEGGSTFACTADGVALRFCELAFVTGARNGHHTFTIAATDPAGNTDPTPATRSFRVSASVTYSEMTRCRDGGNLIVATNGNDTRVGTARADRMYGRAGDDRLSGESGADCLFGGPGDDRLIGGPGNDLAVGDGSDDSIQGRGADDTLYGAAGDDRIVGGSGRDTLDGGAGADRLSDHTGPDRFYGGPGNDRVDARDTTSYGRRTSDHVHCGSGRDVALVDHRDWVSRDCERVLRGRR